MNQRKVDAFVKCRKILIMASVTWLAAGWVTVSADNALSRSEAESRLKQLHVEIGQLQETLEEARTTLSAEQMAIKNADLEIQANTMKLRKLQETRESHQSRFADLQLERNDYLESLEGRRKLLAEQILAAYRLGRESRLKLVLNQDSPAHLSRTLAYYDYIGRAQTDSINELKQVLDTLDSMQAKINIELTALDEVQTKQQGLLDDLTQQREERQGLIDDLASQIDTNESRLDELQANRRDLEALLERLSDALADIPADLGQRLGPAELKGKLPMPLNGRVKHAYGQPRSAGLRWLGWLIAANSGSEVRAIAYGRVAYADWLRGYGLLMIIDHGDGFLSLYANNESLLFDVGDWVEPGSIISTVGSSTLNVNGLYFEIRKDGKALDPAIWLNR